jgi:hypothetical protein
VDPDQTAAAVIATEKMLNIVAHADARDGSVTDEFRVRSQ